MNFLKKIKSFVGIFPAGIQMLIGFAVIGLFAFLLRELGSIYQPPNKYESCKAQCSPRSARLIPENYSTGVRSMSTKDVPNNLKQCECY
jgi:hypothetical protein